MRELAERFWKQQVRAGAGVRSSPLARSIPSTATASVRAMTRKLGSVRASTAALIRASISWRLTSALPGRWPHRLSLTWSSRWTAAAPARIISRTVRPMASSAPKPVSTSTSRGRSTAPVIRRVSSSTLSREVTPRSGSPKEMLATPAPER